MKVAVIQMVSGTQVPENLQQARELLHQAAQAGVHQFDIVQSLGQKCGFVDQVGLFGLLGQPAFQQIEGFLHAFGFAQQRGFGNEQLHALFRALGLGVAQHLACLVELPLLCEEARAPDLC